MFSTVKLILLVSWLMGIVLAKGVWFKVLATCLPLYSWYLVVELFMGRLGLI